MRMHDLKTHPDYFEAVLHFTKNFEVRKNERGFSPGDILCLKEWDPTTETYTGRQLYRQVGYIASYSGMGLLQEGVVVMDLHRVLTRLRDAMPEV